MALEYLTHEPETGLGMALILSSSDTGERGAVILSKPVNEND